MSELVQVTELPLPWYEFRSDQNTADMYTIRERTTSSWPYQQQESGVSSQQQQQQSDTILALGAPAAKLALRSLV